jgi:hypothetical protein
MTNRLYFKKRNGFRFARVGRASIQFVWCKRAPLADRLAYRAGYETARAAHAFGDWTPSYDAIGVAASFAIVACGAAYATARLHGLI